MAISHQIGAVEFLVQPVPVPAKVDLFGALSSSVLFEDNIVAPLDEAWNANRN